MFKRPGLPSLRSLIEDDDATDYLGALLGPGGHPRGAGGMVRRNPQRGTMFFTPGANLASQPFFGFPGGQRAWEQFKSTGELPVDPLTGRQIELSGPQRSFYYRLAAPGVDPATGDLALRDGSPLAGAQSAVLESEGWMDPPTYPSGSKGSSGGSSQTSSNFPSRTDSTWSGTGSGGIAGGSNPLGTASGLRPTTTTTRARTSPYSGSRLSGWGR